MPAIPRPIPAPTSLPDPGNISFDFHQTRPPQDPDFNLPQRSGQENSYAHLAGPKGDFSLPLMEELGLKPATTQHRGGETQALAELARIIHDEDYTATFSKPETAPTAFSPQSTTLLSPHLHFGSLSVREFYWRAHDVIVGYKKGKAATIPTNLLGQLLFRDMYFGAQAVLGYQFSQSRNNPNCRFIPWHLPSNISPSTGLVTSTYAITNLVAEKWFRRWKFGCTGFPWIDALMRQLRTEGWIHHLGRHAVACFLTRGGCYIDWERGAEVFEEWLLDHEVACNAGNWQWLSCAAFYSQFFRCYSPIAFPKKWDKEGAFVRKFVPELKDYAEKYIYEPWKAPLVDQRRWGCLIRGDGIQEITEEGLEIYPKPMFDFDERRQICIEAIKGAYKVGLYGADDKVKDGSWKALFPNGAEGTTDVLTEETAEGATEKLAEMVATKETESRTTVSAKDTISHRTRRQNLKTAATLDVGNSIIADEDEGEAAALGGETKGGDHGFEQVRKEEEKPAMAKRKRQGTLDGVLLGRGKKGRG